MSTEQFNVMRKEMVENVTGAALEWLAYMGTGAALAAIPDTEPPRYVVAGTLADIVKLLPAAEVIKPAQGGITNLEGLTRYDLAFTGSMQARDDGDYVKFADVERLLAAQAAPASPEQVQAPMVEKVRAAMIRAYNFGQTYWQQADSEYVSQHKKADITAGRFIELTDEICASLAAPVAAAPAAEEVRWISVDERLPEKQCLAVYTTLRGKQRMIRAKYVRRFQEEASGDEIDQCDTEYNEDDDTFYLKAGWLECIDNWGEYSSCYVNEGIVTHWMPLPTAPADAEGDAA